MREIVVDAGSIYALSRSTGISETAGHQGRDTVWCRSVRIYRQQKMHNWQSVFEEIQRDLSHEAELNGVFPRRGCHH